MPPPATGWRGRRSDAVLLSIMSLSRGSITAKWMVPTRADAVELYSVKLPKVTTMWPMVLGGHSGGRVTSADEKASEESGRAAARVLMKELEVAAHASRSVRCPVNLLPAACAQRQRLAAACQCVASVQINRSKLVTTLITVHRTYLKPVRLIRNINEYSSRLVCRCITSGCKRHEIDSSSRCKRTNSASRQKHYFYSAHGARCSSSR